MFSIVVSYFESFSRCLGLSLIVKLLEDSFPALVSRCVALLTILPRQEHIIPVCLPGLRQHFVGQYAFVVGWGRTEHGVAQTPSLLQVSGSSYSSSDNHRAIALSHLMARLCRCGYKFSCLLSGSEGSSDISREVSVMVQAGAQVRGAASLPSSSWPLVAGHHHCNVTCLQLCIRQCVGSDAAT